MNKKQLKNKALIISCALIIIASTIGGLAYAKYITQISGDGILSVAKWIFNIDLKKDSEGNLDLGSRIYDAKSLTQGKIAPGTSGNFEVKIDATGTETGVDYTANFSNIENKPENLYFVVDGTKCRNFEDLKTALSGHFDADANSKIITKNVQWNWDYETTDNGKSKEENNIQDTADGNVGNDFTFKINVVGTQSLI